MTFVLLCWITTYPYTALRTSLHLQPYLGTLSVSAHQYIHVYTDRRINSPSFMSGLLLCMCDQSAISEDGTLITQSSHTLKQYFTTDAWMAVVQRGKIQDWKCHLCTCITTKQNMIACDFCDKWYHWYVYANAVSARRLTSETLVLVQELCWS